MNAIDTRTNFLDPVEQIKKTALDPYATFRSLYRQNRAGKLETLRADKRVFPVARPVSQSASQKPDQPAK
jgi:phospholipid-binding lipoprotein MlaA